MSLETLAPNLQAAVRPLLALLQRGFGPRARSVIGHGPALEFGIGRGSPLSVLVVVDELDVATLRSLAAELDGLLRRGVDPLFLATEQVTGSLDTFPLEFLSMRAAYTVLAGEDLLAPMQFEPGPLRLQIEEELRGILSGFRQLVARQGHKPKLMRAAVGASFAALLPVWRAMLTLGGEAPPAETQALLGAARAAFGLDAEALATYRAIEQGAVIEPPSLWVIVEQFDAFCADLVGRVDRLDAS